MKHADHPLRQTLELTRDQWDQPAERDAVRENFRKVCVCGTAVLGGEVYASAAEEKVCYHTCKSKCCPSCGNRGTLLWQREQWATLPDIPFVGIVLTMPDVFWPIFKAHRHLQHDLPALGAAVLQQSAWNRYQVRLCGIVIQHTFGRRLNYHLRCTCLWISSLNSSGRDDCRNSPSRCAFQRYEVTAKRHRSMICSWSNSSDCTQRASAGFSPPAETMMWRCG
jgi:hypothetical protein